jgi:CheY-like chemotaxis protein/HPt (histidine-containing phosphotransfer) domain-containing protein
VAVDVTLLQRESASIRLGFRVSDTGIGIPVEAQPRLFDEFTQVDGSISRRFGGSGLGLAISRRLVEQMGGSITVDSSPGAGSVFSFNVKLKARRATDGGRTPRLAGASPTAGPLHILVAEDNPTNRLVVTRMLERMGHTVLSVTNGAEAVEAVKATRFDVVLMDVMMPEMDGLAATRLIRQLPSPRGYIPIIGLTANAMRADEAASALAGMDRFATKPIASAVLLEVINELIGVAPDGAAAEHPGCNAAEDRPLHVPVENRGFDPAVLDAMAASIGSGPTADIVQAFIETSRRQIAAVPGLALAGDANELMRHARLLANTAQTIGLMRLGRATDELANLAGEDLTTVNDKLREVRGLFEAGLDDLRNWRAPG